MEKVLMPSAAGRGQRGVNMPSFQFIQRRSFQACADEGRSQQGVRHPLLLGARSHGKILRGFLHLESLVNVLDPILYMRIKVGGCVDPFIRMGKEIISVLVARIQAK